MKISYYTNLGPRDYAHVIWSPVVDDFGNEIELIELLPKSVRIDAFYAAIGFAPLEHLDNMCGEH
ncbi:hypothetical protein LMG24238_06935 [Paraburkholderia sediminicola]|uniref:Uncharacterized protein n=1 Tax=Paraburkholderia sediminicola TaxID=458836 RepID=A0A6J5CRZ9_9BURK|nr:hypothetical protein [Paraburkholderia sediminicola]CAB3742757.1 hypothetical protein LMG24238_06935 [Paraburkholderia sediminicola]